jgi:hypothetical protein
MMAEPKRNSRPGDADRNESERRHQEDALDEALENTFPASDPVSTEQPKAARRREPQAKP